MSDPTDIRAHDQDAETDEVLARERRRKELEDLKWLMAHPQGRRVATRILAEAGIYRSSFNHSGSVMAFNEGRRQIGLWFQAEIVDATPKGHIKMLEELQAKDE